MKGFHFGYVGGAGHPCHDGRHEVILRKAFSPLLVTSWAHCMRYSTWSFILIFQTARQIFIHACCLYCW